MSSDGERSGDGAGLGAEDALEEGVRSWVPPAGGSGADATGADATGTDATGTDAAGDDAGEEAGLRVKLANFEGPLDLLLHLIKRDQLDIHDIPIAHITSQYLAMIETMQLLNLEVAGEFLVMASSLMRIKSRTLLPPTPIEDEEEEGDPREELMRRLLEYRKFKEVAERLREQEELRARRHSKGYLPRVDSDEPLPLKPVSLFQLVDVLRAVLARREAVEPVHAVELPPVTVEERMEHIRELLAGGWGQVRFVEVIADCRARIEIVSTVMALLELIRLGEVVARQYEEFGAIWIFDPERLGLARRPPRQTPAAGAEAPVSGAVDAADKESTT